MKGNACFLEELMQLIKMGKLTELHHRLRPEVAILSGDLEIYGREVAARWLRDNRRLPSAAIRGSRCFPGS